MLVNPAIRSVSRSSRSSAFAIINDFRGYISEQLIQGKDGELIPVF